MHPDLIISLFTKSSINIINYFIAKYSEKRVSYIRQAANSDDNKRGP